MAYYMGCLCLIAGVGITMMDLVYPHSFSTVLEVDYDTPYDRHVIIEDSHGRRQLRKKASQPKLEEPPGIGVGLGSRILRRLSSKSREGIDNQAFELDPPKSPWRYPFRTGLVPVPVPVPASASVSVSAARVDRSHSQDSASSMASHTHMPSVHRDIARTIGLRQPTDKLREVSMW